MGPKLTAEEAPRPSSGLAREAFRGVSYVKFLKKEPLLQKIKKICTDKLLEM